MGRKPSTGVPYPRRYETTERDFWVIKHEGTHPTVHSYGLSADSECKTEEELLAKGWIISGPFHCTEGGRKIGQATSQ